jgi:ABC-2 type transport system permease protein
MLNTIAIMRKELRTYFASPLAYVVIAAFLAGAGLFFAILIWAQQGATSSLDIVFTNMPVVLLFLGPVLTMRLLAEEQKAGTVEVLLTSPVRDWEVVIGKYLASLVLFLIPVAITLLYPLALNRYTPPDLGPIIGGYIGLILFGASFLAVGLFTSSLTQNQVVAALVAIILLLAMWLIAVFAGNTRPPVSDILNYVSIISHYNEFSQGLIDTRNIVYYLIVIVGSLFLTTRSLESRRWT